MSRNLMLVAVLLQLLAGRAMAEEFDAIVNDPTRAFTKNKNSPESFFYAKIRLDTQGKIVSTIIKEGKVNEETKVVTGTFDEKKKEWTPGEAIEGGIGAELFKNKGKVLRVLVKLADDGVTIQQIMVTNPDEMLEEAKGEFDAIYKGHGRTNLGGRIAFSYVRVDLDDKGNVIKSFPLTVTSSTPETKYAMGKYNEETKKWEAGEEIPKCLYGDVLADPGAKNIYVRLTYRADGRGLAQVLVRKVGDE